MMVDTPKRTPTRNQSRLSRVPFLLASLGLGFLLASCSNELPIIGTKDSKSTTTSVVPVEDPH